MWAWERVKWEQVPSGPLALAGLHATRQGDRHPLLFRGAARGRSHAAFSMALQGSSQVASSPPWAGSTDSAVCRLEVATGHSGRLGRLFTQQHVEGRGGA